MINSPNISKHVAPSMMETRHETPRSDSAGFSGVYRHSHCEVADKSCGDSGSDLGGSSKSTNKNSETSIEYPGQNPLHYKALKGLVKLLGAL